MTGIRIRALSEKGQAIMKNIMKADGGRSDWKLFFKERVESDDPYVIVVEHKNRVARSWMKAEFLADIVQKQFKGLGALDGVDYEVVVL